MKFLLSSLFQLGDLDYYIGILVKHTVSGSIILTQAKYIWDLLQKTLHAMQMGETAMECFVIRLIPHSGRRLLVCIRILAKRQEILGFD